MNEKSTSTVTGEDYKLTTLQVPLRSVTQAQIKEIVFDAIQSGLEEYSPSELYVFFKQLETLVKEGLESLKSKAFDSAGKALGGETEGEILGHKLKLTWPKKWVYSEAIDEFIERQKKELEMKKTEEELNGRAHQEPALGVIRVTLRAK